MNLGLVLGAGGMVGIAYHAGVLHALEELAGVGADDADLVVGTSAGSVIGAHLRSGWGASDCWKFALGVHPLQLELDEAELQAQQDGMLTPTWESPVQLARRALGSAYVFARSFVRVPLPDVPVALRRGFPGGLYEIEDARTRFSESLPEEWPGSPLWLVAVDITSGRRVVLGRRGAPELSLHDAVLASCAIPGVYPPVRADGCTLVDGGAHSTTNLDLAARAGCRLIIGVAPMAYDPTDRPHPMGRIVRQRATMSLGRELVYARSQGAEVLLVRPTAAEVRLHGSRFMRPESTEDIARAAYESTARLLETPRFRRVLGERAA